MILSLECQQCAADFELELAKLVDDPAAMACPNCGVKADATIVEALATSLDESLSLAGRLLSKFRIEFALDLDELNVDEQEIYDDGDSLWADDMEDGEDEMDD